MGKLPRLICARYKDCGSFPLYGEQPCLLPYDFGGMFNFSRRRLRRRDKQET